MSPNTSYRGKASLSETGDFKYIKFQETPKEVNFLKGSLLPTIMRRKKSPLKDELPIKQNCLISYHSMQQPACASLLLLGSVSDITTETIRSLTNFPIIQIELIWMPQPVLLTNVNQKQGLETVIEENAIKHDFLKKEKTHLLQRPPFHTAPGSYQALDAK